jgi:ABC-2 type transport system permease protein
VIPRDLRNFAQLLTPLVLLPIVYFNLLSGRGGRRRADNFDDLLGGFGGGALDPRGIVIAAGILFATVLIFRRVASNAISMEGRAWWIMKIAPIDPRELLRGKLAAALIPFAILSTVLLLGAEFWQRFSLLGFVYGWVGIELLGAAILATAVGASAPWARFDWDDPKRMSSGWGSAISLAVGLTTAGLAGLALCLPLVAEAFLPQFVVAAWLLGPLLAVAIVAATVWASLALGAQFLARVGEA